MKSLADDGGVVPRGDKTRLFQPIWTPYTGQICAPDVARTTFHTVSEEEFPEVRGGICDEGLDGTCVSRERLQIADNNLLGALPAHILKAVAVL